MYRNIKISDTIIKTIQRLSDICIIPLPARDANIVPGDLPSITRVIKDEKDMFESPERKQRASSGKNGTKKNIKSIICDLLENTLSYFSITVLLTNFETRGLPNCLAR